MVAPLSNVMWDSRKNRAGMAGHAHKLMGVVFAAMHLGGAKVKKMKGTVPFNQNSYSSCRRNVVSGESLVNANSSAAWYLSPP